MTGRQMNRVQWLVLGILALTPTITFGQLGNDLELYYTFDDDSLSAGGILDRSGNGRNASPDDADPAGDLGFSADVPAAIGAGKSLDASGVMDFLVADDYTGIAGSQDRTISGWVKSESVAIQHLVEWGTNNPGERFTFRINNNAGNGTLGGLRTEVQSTFVVNDVVIADGAWHHVAVVFEDDGTPNKDDISLYVDGAIAGLTTTNGNDPVINTVLNNGVAFAGSNVFADRGLDGLMDDVAIWSRALSADEIASVASGAQIPEPTSGLLLAIGLLAMLGIRRRSS